jgi:hypothetical protein
MDEADDPDPDGWPVHPAVVFYGLWPRFVVGEGEAAEPDDAGREEAGAAAV